MAPYHEPPQHERPVKPAPRLSSATYTGLYMLTWMVASNSTVLFNKWILHTAGFDYPILLTGWHLSFAAIVTQIVARTTSLLDSRRSLPINRRFYLHTILPVGLVSSGSIVCSNVVYIYLSVAFIQMLKAGSPVVILFVSWIWGTAHPSLGIICNILVIVAGVALASAGEIAISWTGFTFQLAGLVFEAIRVVMLQVMLSSEGMNMDALVGLYYSAPVCAVINFMIAYAVEIPRFQWEDFVNVGPLLLLLNAAIGFLVSLTSMVLIGKTSALVTTLTGIFKNILLIVCSGIIWHTKISSLQILGYSISLSGLVYYAFGFDKLVAAWLAVYAWAARAPALFKSSSTSFKVLLGLGLVILFFFSASARP